MGLLCLFSQDCDSAIAAVIFRGAVIKTLTASYASSVNAKFLHYLLNDFRESFGSTTSYAKSPAMMFSNCLHGNSFPFVNFTDDLASFSSIIVNPPLFGPRSHPL